MKKMNRKFIIRMELFVLNLQILYANNKDINENNKLFLFICKIFNSEIFM